MVSATPNVLRVNTSVIQKLLLLPSSRLSILEMDKSLWQRKRQENKNKIVKLLTNLLLIDEASSTETTSPALKRLSIFQCLAKTAEQFPNDTRLRKHSITKRSAAP